MKTAERAEGGTLRAGAEQRGQAPPTGGVDGGGRTGRNRVLFSGCSVIGEETPKTVALAGFACVFGLFGARIYFIKNKIKGGLAKSTVQRGLLNAGCVSPPQH